MRPTLVLSIAASLAGFSFASPTPASPWQNGHGLTRRQQTANFTFSDGTNLTDIRANEHNTNTRNPLTPIFPQKESGDAPYDMTEAQLRAPIFIPANFTYGEKPPVLLISGTGTTAPQSFQGNYMKYLNNVGFADPVWINFPNAMLNDCQDNAQMIAYAMNYVSGISGGKNISVVTWSQGGLVTQWALKYWPSTRKAVKNFVAIAPDFKGTTWELTKACLFVPCVPNSYQQMWGSKFAAQLAKNGGDSALVPTTTIYSKDDQIVQPSHGKEASSYLKDDHGVGVSNIEVQEACPGPYDGAGGSWSHEGLLYNNLAVNLALDALKNGGPAKLERLEDLKTLCQRTRYKGVTAFDVWAGQFGLFQSTANLLGGGPTGARVFSEPPLKAYVEKEK